MAVVLYFFITRTSLRTCWGAVKRCVILCDRAVILIIVNIGRTLHHYYSKVVDITY